MQAPRINVYVGGLKLFEGKAHPREQNNCEQMQEKAVKINERKKNGCERKRERGLLILSSFILLSQTKKKKKYEHKCLS